jgi:glycosyltransferase involved in cell wall biosynthesis
MWNKRRISIVLLQDASQEGISDLVAEVRRQPTIDELVLVRWNIASGANDAPVPVNVVLNVSGGIGEAWMTGIQHASGDYIIFMRADGSYMAKDVQKFFAYTDDFDMILGTRTSKEMIWHGADLWSVLRIGNELSAKFLQYLFGGPSITDIGSEFRLVKRRVLEKLLPAIRTRSSTFLLEMMIIGFLDDVRTVEVPVNYRARLGKSRPEDRWDTMMGDVLRKIAVVWWYRILFLFKRPEEN